MCGLAPMAAGMFGKKAQSIGIASLSPGAAVIRALSKKKDKPTTAATPTVPA